MLAGRYVQDNLTTKQSVDSKYFLGWPNEGIVEWVYGLPKGKYGHPLEQAHILIAEKINESIRRGGGSKNPNILYARKIRFGYFI